MQETRGTVLIVDDNADISEIVGDVLTEEGYAIEILRDRNLESVKAAVERLRPDCVLLDGEIPGSFGASWDEAAWLTALPAPVPVIMFTGEQRATDKARRNTSTRSEAARFSSILLKPFDLDELVRAVALAVSQSPKRRRR
jgi:CheY-like chemotaxis protein